MQPTIDIYVIRKAIFGTATTVEYKIITCSRLPRKKNSKKSISITSVSTYVSITLTQFFYLMTYFYDEVRDQGHRIVIKNEKCLIFWKLFNIHVIPLFYQNLMRNPLKQKKQMQNFKYFSCYTCFL